MYDPRQGGIASTVLLICRTDALLLGVLCAWIVRQDGGPERMARWAPVLRILFLSGAGFAMLAAYVTFVEVGSDEPVNRFFIQRHLQIYTPQSAFGRMSRWGWLRRLGFIAYGTYLIHEGVLGFVFGLSLGRWPRILAGRDVLVNLPALAITICLAVVSWRWFEKPIVTFGRRRWKYEVIR